MDLNEGQEIGERIAHGGGSLQIVTDFGHHRLFIGLQGSYSFVANEEFFRFANIHDIQKVLQLVTEFVP